MDEYENPGDLESYDMELERAINTIKEKKAKIVALQMPDGLKRFSNKIADKIQEATGAQVIIWGGSCYGACDLCVDVERLGADVLIHWGHKEWVY